MVEIQIHPSDIRKNVRYFFLSKERIALLLAVMAVFCLIMLWTLGIAPVVLRNIWQISDYNRSADHHSAEEVRLDNNLRGMEKLLAGLDAQRASMEKFHFIYGIPMLPHGLGGFPPAPKLEVAESPFASNHPEVARAVALETQLRQEMKFLETLFEELRLYEAGHQDVLSTTPSICPIEDEFVLTSPFGSRISPFTRERDFHTALDMAAPEGTRVLAAAEATVTFAGRYPLRESVNWWRYGNVVVLRHGERFITIYAHLADVRVRRGDKIGRGEWIATVGSTGWSTSPHLHYEVRTNIENVSSIGKPALDGYVPVDPRIYILNHSWSQDDLSLIRNRSIIAYNDFNPLPSIFK